MLAGPDDNVALFSVSAITTDEREVDASPVLYIAYERARRFSIHELIVYRLYTSTLQGVEDDSGTSTEPIVVRFSTSVSRADDVWFGRLCRLV